MGKLSTQEQGLSDLCSRNKQCRTTFQDAELIGPSTSKRLHGGVVCLSVWCGGVFECLVRSTNHCLKKMVGRSRLSLNELNTVLAEVETIINSRPLSYILSEDLEEPLTPSHLLTGRRILSLPDRLVPSRDSIDEEFMLASTSNQLKNWVKRLSNALNYFWIRWRDDSYQIEGCTQVYQPGLWPITTKYGRGCYCSWWRFAPQFLEAWKSGESIGWTR